MFRIGLKTETITVEPARVFATIQPVSCKKFELDVKRDTSKRMNTGVPRAHRKFGDAIQPQPQTHG